MKPVRTSMSAAAQVVTMRSFSLANAPRVTTFRGTDWLCE